MFVYGVLQELPCRIPHVLSTEFMQTACRILCRAAFYEVDTSWLQNSVLLQGVYKLVTRCYDFLQGIPRPVAGFYVFSFFVKGVYASWLHDSVLFAR